MMHQSSEIKNYTRGGQITLHNIRMFIQITNKVILAALIVFLIFFMTVAWFLITDYERYIADQYVWSMIIPFFKSDAATTFTQPNGFHAIVKYTDIHSSMLIKRILKNIAIKCLWSILAGLMGAAISFIGLSAWLKKRGKSQTENRLIKGDKFDSADAVKQILLQQQMSSDLILAELPLVKNKETRHFFIHGTTGAGKSNAIKELMDQIRARGDRAIIYDKSCNFLEEFYLPNHDIVLNPMDERCETWNLWDECRDSADFDSLAAAQIPMPVSSSDPFWVNAARTIFSAAAFEMRNDPNRSILKLLRYLLTADLERIELYLKGTEAETLVSRKTEKTAISIKSVLATYLKSLKYLKSEGKPFSIRQWINNEEGSNWLFITSVGDRHETLKPLITTWLDIAANALLSLAPSEDRRIWLILDELASLHRLPYLTQTLSEARKFGGCAVIGIQNFAQLEEEYGNRGARKISSLLNTRYLFREPDPDVAKWSAENFGEAIINEVREGISYGANTMRDGISINQVETKKSLVSFSEIMSLDDLSAYVRLPGHFPVTKVKFKYTARSKKNDGLMQRDIDSAQLKEVDDLLNHFQSTVVNEPQSTTSQKTIDHETALDI